MKSVKLIFHVLELALRFAFWALLRIPVYTGPSLFIGITCLNKISCIGITMTDGDFWQEQRNFATRHLRNLGFGKSHMESLIIEEFQVRNLNKLLKFE